MQPSVRKKSWMNRFIDTIEYWGNKLPHPFILFGMLVVITLIGSWILSQAGCSITYMAASRTPGEPEKEVTIAVTNLLSGENLRYLITKYPDIFIGYPPMKLVLVMMAATAFIEKTGFFGTFMKKYLLRAPRSLVTFAVVFVGVNSNLMSDAGTLFALTMGGIIFAALGRNPLIGVILGWASSSGKSLPCWDGCSACRHNGRCRQGDGRCSRYQSSHELLLYGFSDLLPFCDAYPFYGKGCLPYGR